MTIPVICDRCRVAGTAGTGDFSQFGDLLDFDPVEVRYRVNGWDPDAQRAFIALLATTGSKRRAAQAIGRNAFGIDQLLKRADAASFRAAYDRAMAIAQQNGAMKLATGVADVAARTGLWERAGGRQASNAQFPPPSRLRGHPAPLLPAAERWGGGPFAGEQMVEGSLTDEDHETLAVSLFGKYLMKVQQERTARLAGKVVEADFCLRQVTFFEVALDLAQDAAQNREGVDTWTWLSNLRRDSHTLFDIAQTPFSRFLDEARRLVWSGELEQLERPDHPPEDHLVHGDGYSLEPLECIQGGPGVNIEKRQRELEERHRKAAAEQVEWERTQHRG